jgi:hypothetical protein
VDRREHTYILDLNHLMETLAGELASRGYSFIKTGEAGVWHVRTRWPHGAAYGEIGGLIYSVLATDLQEAPNPRARTPIRDGEA